MEDSSAPQQLDAEELVKRYAVYAEVMGRQRDRKNENDSDEHPVYKQRSRCCGFTAISRSRAR